MLNLGFKQRLFVCFCLFDVLFIQKSHSGMNGSHLKLSKESITCTTPGSFSYSSFLLAESTTTIL